MSLSLPYFFFLRYNWAFKMGFRYVSYHLLRPGGRGRDRYQTHVLFNFFHPEKCRGRRCVIAIVSITIRTTHCLSLIDSYACLALHGACTTLAIAWRT